MKKTKQKIVPRRLKIVPVAESIFDAWLRTGSSPKYVVKEGLPEDSHLVGIRHDLVTGVVHLLYESAEFDVVKEGDVPPVFEPTLQTIAED